MPNNLDSKKILSYDDLVVIAQGNSNEPLVSVQKYSSSIVATYNKLDMKVYAGDTILVRDSVAKKLAAVNKSLMTTNDVVLKVVYGYRHPDVQKQYFYNRKVELHKENPSPSISETELVRLTHSFVAVPSVAGHPTGGAVDVTVVDKYGKDLDFGNIIADYTNPEVIKTFADVPKEQSENRTMLHNAMVSQGFAPFYGEWWHFSYGDREWAAFYNKKTALYSAINL